MATFKFYQEYNVVRKVREYYTIEADTLEDARAKAEEVTNLEEIDGAEFIDTEDVIDETQDYYDYQCREITGIYDEDGEEIN